MTSSTEVSVIDVYQRHGVAWARMRSDTLVEALWLDRFCAILPAGAAVLDIGCGSGLPIARELVRRGFDITGIDATPAMLAQFRRNLPGVAAQLADMRRLALGRRFAGLLAWDSFFHLSPAEQRDTIPRFQAHAAPGAALMFTSGDAEGEAIGELEGDPLYHGSLDPEEYRSLLAAAGFTVIAHTPKDPDCGHRTIWLAQQKS
ncbi:class I SAM-dependent methyltransferase [Sphingobium phenoxybenzoativorans]|uniref:Class I SAM-dependent methyltransferase n=1 Tax=Sphingobium phenoxybenzoativorans TaxID=1592790 RepID=A0A975Q0Y6_9SPHN|nr:class I SAM-dependent methyltransferase [Sphingobium phenoxybenzoativorans]QUT05096.1 class I SAM-dependent methyltransferase [Sphingobium phenoxybenzoativorans]